MSEKKNGNKTGLLIALCVIMAFLIIGMGVFFFWDLHQSEKSPKEKQSAQKQTEGETEPETFLESGMQYDETSNTVTYDDGDYAYRPDKENLRYDEDTATLYYDNVLTVYLLSEIDEDSANLLADRVGGTVVGKVSGLTNVLQILVEPSDLEELKAYADKLMESDDVLYASYDSPMLIEETADDKNTWSNNEKTIDGKGDEDNPDGNDWWAEAIKAYTAWKLIDGQKLRPVHAGVLDSGFDADHDDLKDNLSLLYGYRENTESDHGTHVAGTIAAINNEIGLRGIADSANLICADWSPTDEVSYLSSMEYIKIFEKMIRAGAKAINNSWGFHIKSKEKYVLDTGWTEVGYYNKISKKYIRLKEKRNGNGYDNEYPFREKDETQVEFYIAQRNVTYKEFKKEVKNGDRIGLILENDVVTKVYLIEDISSYVESVRFTGAYDNYLASIQTEAEQKASQCALMIAQMVLSGRNDFLMVQSAGNGLDNGGDAIEAKRNGAFCTVDESIYRSLPSATLDKLNENGITYTDIDSHIMVVGAVRNQKNDAGYYLLRNSSNYGEAVDICAPGEEIFSTVTEASGNYSNLYSGTSMAAPMVTGAATLLWQIKPNLSAADVKRKLCQETDRKAIGVGADEGTLYPMLNIGKAVKSLLGDEKKGNVKKEDVTRDIVLVLDRSGSMSGYPMEQTKEAANRFIDTVFEKESQVSVVAYDSAANVESSLSNNQHELAECIDGISSGGGTNMYAGLEQADRILQGSQAQRKIVVLMSDGLPNEGVSDEFGYSEPLIQYAEEMKNRGYYIYTLGFFTGVADYELTSAQQLMEGIASPGLHYEVNSAEDLVFFFDDIADQITGTRFVYIRIACPVDVTVSSNGETLTSKPDSENTRTSFGALTYENVQEDTEAAYEEYSYEDLYDSFYGDEESVVQDRVKVLRLNMDEDYEVEIEGYDKGKMDYTVSYPNENGEYDDVREFPNIAVTASTKAVSDTGEAEATYLKVDKDGDGKYETTYKTEANGKMEEVKDKRLLYLVILGVAILILAILLLILVLVRISNKKKQGERRKGWESVKEGYIYGAFGIFGGRSYPLGRGERCIVGRSSDCDIQLKHSQVSRVHCVIEILPDGVYQVTDCSSNGTFYNNQRLLYKEPYRLPKGALLAIGDADNVLELK